MREFARPPTFDLSSTGSLTDDLLRNAHEVPDLVSFSRRTGSGWQDVTAADFLREVRAVAKGLVASGLDAGDRIGLMSGTRYEWTLVDYAIWYVGAITVPLYETSSADQIEWILSDSTVHGIVVGGPEQVSRVSSVRGRLEELQHVWSLDGGAVQQLTVLGAQVTDDDLEARRLAVTPAAAATIIYTLGTTGQPKGCVLTHANFMTELGVAVRELEELFSPADGSQASTLVILPLAHVFARIVQIGAVKARVRLGHSAGGHQLLADLAEFEPTFLLAVPRVFEKVFNTASQRAAAEGRAAVFDRATSTAIAYSHALDRGRMRPLLTARRALFDRLVYGRLREVLGGRCAFAISGGAPLGERLGHFYRGIGLTVLEGYGLTETTAAVTANLPTANKIGSVGRPLPGVTVRIAGDGELLVRGGQVMRGYWHDDAATAEVLRDGWFHTGDIGEIDEEGFVRITGRKKEILVTAGGKNVAPAMLEDRIRSHYLVSQCMVVGDGEPFVAALVTIDPEAFASWRTRHRKRGSVSELVQDADLVTEIQAAVDEANKAVSQAESVRKFSILPVEWTEEGGQLTPSLKLKRNVAMRECRVEIDALYGS